MIMIGIGLTFIILILMAIYHDKISRIFTQEQNIESIVNELLMIVLV